MLATTLKMSFDMLVPHSLVTFGAFYLLVSKIICLYLEWHC